MKKFSIKSSLAAGLAFKLNGLDGQLVVDTVGTDAIKAIRSLQGIVDKVRMCNKDFEDAITETEQKKRAIFDGMKAKYDKLPVDMPTEEKAAKGRELTEKFNAEAAKIQKESKADPDTIIAVTLSDEDYERILMPVFKKTVQLWDVNGDGNGQKLFLEVANALEDVVSS